MYAKSFSHTKPNGEKIRKFEERSRRSPEIRDEFLYIRWDIRAVTKGLISGVEINYSS